MSRRVANWLPICALTLAILVDGSAGCGAPETPAKIEAAPQPAEPAVPPEIAAVAAATLGGGAEVVAFGDLAHNGRQQVLVANRIGAAGPVAKGTEQGVRFTRAAVFEQAGAKWSEVLRCDEFLKNPNGYLGGTPRQPVTGWRLELSKQSGHPEGELLFTPLQDSGAPSAPAIAVRWNPALARYQSFDSQSGRFLEELHSLETPVSPLR
jgi:hypothetical protein